MLIRALVSDVSRKSSNRDDFQHRFTLFCCFFTVASCHCGSAGADGAHHDLAEAPGAAAEVAAGDHRAVQETLRAVSCHTGTSPFFSGIWPREATSRGRLLQSCTCRCCRWKPTYLPSRAIPNADCHGVWGGASRVGEGCRAAFPPRKCTCQDERPRMSHSIVPLSLLLSWTRDLLKDLQRGLVRFLVKHRDFVLNLIFLRFSHTGAWNDSGCCNCRWKHNFGTVPGQSS